MIILGTVSSTSGATTLLIWPPAMLTSSRSASSIIESSRLSGVQPNITDPSSAQLASSEARAMRMGVWPPMVSAATRQHIEGTGTAPLRHRR